MATVRAGDKAAEIIRFNPHPSQDGNVAVKAVFDTIFGVSIHIPARMATGPACEKMNILTVSIHIPARMATAKTPTTPHHLSPPSINFFNIPLFITRHPNNSQSFQPLPSIIPVRTSRLSLFTSHSHQAKHLPFQNFRKHSHYFSPA